MLHTGRGLKAVGLVAIVLTGIVTGPAPATPAQTRETGDTSRRLPAVRGRFTFVKPSKTRLTGLEQTDRIVIKFREGTRVRLRDGKLEAPVTTYSASDQQLLRQTGLEPAEIQQELNQANRLLSGDTKLRVERLFASPERDLEVEQHAAASESREELADLNLYHAVTLEASDPQTTERLIDRLNALDCVEIAYAQPIPSVPAIDIAPSTSDLTAGQGYLEASATRDSTRNGIDAKYAWSFAGGKGEGVRWIDVEQGWNLDHEDLPSVFHTSGWNLQGPAEHGTAVLGVVGAVSNPYGVTGIAAGAAAGVASSYENDNYNVARAINQAAKQLRRGDILVIEQHYPGPRTDPTRKDQVGFVPVEYYAADFDAIRSATARGIIVVEAAGNGSQDLDDPFYGGRFDFDVRDSGAIMVGAGSSGGRVPMWFTNYGYRVDVHGWGENVMTAGYGDIQFNGTDVRQWYTRKFAGTSSATPIVAGAVAAIQGILRARGLTVLDPDEMRWLLWYTGTSQAADRRQIGPLPNLRAALEELGIQ